MGVDTDFAWKMPSVFSSSYLRIPAPRKVILRKLNGIGNQLSGNPDWNMIKIAEIYREWNKS